MSSYQRWLVVATAMGQYDQILREPGEVFELLPNEDGTVPPMLRAVPRKTADGRPVLDEVGDPVVDETPVVGADGLPLHRDFAEDTGDQLIKRGALKGEVMRFGWMRRVADETPCGLYPPGTDFWPGESRAAAPRRAATSAPQPAPVRGTTVRPRHERAP